MAKAKEYVLKSGRLWPDTPSGNPLDIEIMGATGEVNTGKTLLGMSIAPGRHPEGHPFAGQPRTLWIDLEKSACTFGGLGAERVDAPARLVEKWGESYKPIQVYLWFVDRITAAKPGQYDLIGVDPINDLESGLVEWVKQNAETVGYTKNQLSSSTPLLMGAVKAHWKQLLLRLSSRCKCFYFTTHLRNEFAGGKPTGKREPKGKDTILELASLYLWLERKPNEKGEVPEAPSAVVIKQRLADTSIDEAGRVRVLPLMPPRIPVCTAETIRQYIASPPDYGKLREGERFVEKAETEADMERLKLARAQAESEAANARLNLAERQAQLAALQAANRSSATTTATASDQTAKAQQNATEKREANARQAASQEEIAKQQAEIDRLKAESEAKLAAAKEAEAKLLAAAEGAHGEARDVGKEVQQTNQQAAASNGNGNGASNGNGTAGGDFATRQQCLEAAELCKQLFGENVKQKLTELLSKAGVSKLSELKREDCLLLIEKLKSAVAKRAVMPTKN